MLDFKKKKIIIILGHCGSGKSSLGKMLLCDGVPKIISNTSRKLRVTDGEIDGVDYYFKPKESFTNDTMLEFSEVLGEYYGISWMEIDNKLMLNDTVYAIMEIDGALKVKKLLGDRVDVRIVLITSNQDTCRERMIKRGDNPDSIEKRISKRNEYEEYANWKYVDCIIKNDNSLKYAYDELHKYVFE